ncbi:hypothetical protein GLS40_13635 [Pseudooceanicola sp. 216_PA32_1]|uniref:Uncharacterized protein n=1 Tax=Pseudooceanicola pacificus TaxID=2676438 RepID=A0A844W4C2_9RHOB|nr:hypothetical protein [Pseudooceanicola pacificus]MWB79076.1 hypothetical protein [Pseudooceanicola pacificus]
MSIRFWMDGPEGRDEVWNGFARCFGATAGRAEMRSFESLLTSLCTFARRPLVRHGLGCTCIGSDEAILTTLAREAICGDLAEATMIASLLVPVRHAEPVALLAAQVGPAMQRMARRGPTAQRSQPGPQDRTFH